MQIPLCDCTYEESNNVEISGCPYRKKLEEKCEVVVLSLSEFVKLNMSAKIKGEVKPTMIKTNDLLFLSSVMKELSANYDSELSIINDTVKIKVRKDDGSEINSTFDLKLCEKYYNKVNKFISEVL